MKKIGIYGASGHGKVVAGIAKLLGFEVIYIDDAKEDCLSLEEFQKRYNFPIAWGIGDNDTRRQKAPLIEHFATLVHPKAVVAEGVHIGEGSVVMAGAIINPDARIGAHTIINTAAVIEHDCTVGDYVHIAPNCALAGGVQVGEGSFVGIGSSVIQNVAIGKDVLVGAASLVLENIGDGLVAYGVPARVRGKNEIS